METGIVRIRMSSKIPFLKVVKTTLKIISGSSVQGVVVLPVLIDNFTFLFVYALFIVNVELTLVNFNKQTLHLRTSGNHLFALLYASLSFSFFGFSLQGRRRSPTCPQILPRKKKSIKRPDTHTAHYTYTVLLF